MSDAGIWYIGINGQQHGPLSTQQVVDMIHSGQINQTAYAYGQTAPQWTPIAQVPWFSNMFTQQPAPPPPPAGPAPIVVDQIDYDIVGADSQYVDVTLDPGEAAIADASTLFYMDQGIRPEAIRGDAAASFSGNLGAMTLFTNHGKERQKVSFSAPYASKIVPLDLPSLGGALIVQKDAFLCAAKGITVDVAWSKPLGSGLMATEGYTLQKIEGAGFAFVVAGGTVVTRDLREGETLRMEAGCLVALEPRVAYDVQWMSGFTTAQLGGDGVAIATVQGPGRLWMQTLPFSRLAGRLLAAQASTRT
ncbi:MAG: AIM24 family protein [Kofleriaceae bacterium]|nr:AIM24 family protein [Kofleriaceae bacterium]